MNDADDAVLLVDVDDGVATVTLNRPRVRNALDARLRGELWRAVESLDADDAIRVIVLTGTDPAFCAGLDLTELGSTEGGLAGRDDRAREHGDGVATDLAISGGARPIPDTSKPVIGAINGVAITGGFELALACDFLVASEAARFADTHARVGIQPGWGLTVALPQAVGVRRARELSFTGNFLDATRAYEWGLVNRVVPHAELMGVVDQLAREIADNDAAGVRRIRRTYAEGALLAGAEALDLEARVSAAWIEQVAGADVESRRAAVIERGRRQV